MNRLVKLMLCIATILISLGVYAQGSKQAGKQAINNMVMPQKPSDEEIAKKMTNEMQMDLGLTDKQYKKIYKINLQQIKKQTSANTQKQSSPTGGDMDMMGGGMDMGGGPMGGGPMGGMGGGPAGGMGGGRPSMGNSTPDMNNAQVEKGGNRPPVQYKETEETVAYKAAKFKKILTPEQYNKWIAKEKDKLNKEFWKNNPEEENRPAVGNPLDKSK
jgi:hypothetical protein